MHHGPYVWCDTLGPARSPGHPRSGYAGSGYYGCHETHSGIGVSVSPKVLQVGGDSPLSPRPLSGSEPGSTPGDSWAVETDTRFHIWVGGPVPDSHPTP